MPNRGVATGPGEKCTCPQFFSSPEAVRDALAAHHAFALFYAVVPSPLACFCRPPSYVERRFFEPGQLADQCAGERLDAPWPQARPDLNGLLSDESGPFPYHP